MDCLIPINYGCVLLFGISLSLSFGDIPFWTNKWKHFLAWCGFGLVQALAFVFFGEDILFKAYPLIVHLPLFLLLIFYYKRNAYVAGIAVLSAYLFCTPRKWIGTFISAFFAYNINISYLVQIVITLPLYILIVKFISPYAVRLKYESKHTLKFVIIVPLAYYLIAYALTVYSNLLYTGGAASVEFMDTFIVSVYLITIIVYLKTLYEKKQVEIEHEVLTSMVAGFEKELEMMRQSQEQASIYRHDLRHHMNYLNTCISEENLMEATTYIQEICNDIENTRIVRYSQNDPVNLVVSSYVNQAEKKGIPIKIHISAVDFSRFQIIDLCSLLANAMENAMNACEEMNPNKERFIRLDMYEKSNKLCLKICNSYEKAPVLKHGMPISNQREHGVGTKSMVHIVEKYHGIYRFIAKEGVFTFQMSM
ncbi:MAG: sensor histidine kinase [Anaerostipes sp.]|jgi:two-component system sensor histidine kinase AgrC